MYNKGNIIYVEGLTFMQTISNVFGGINKGLDYCPGVSTGKGVVQLVSQLFHKIHDKPLVAPPVLEKERNWIPVRREGNTYRSVLLCIPVLGNLFVLASDIGALIKRKDIENKISNDPRSISNEELEKAVRFGSGKAAYELGVRSVRLEERMSWFEIGAELGDANAMYKVAIAYEAKARAGDFMKWIKRSASRGHTDAMIKLGQILTQPAAQGSWKIFQRWKEKEGFAWLKLAKEKGNIAASAPLGRCYLNGIGVRENIDAGINVLSEGERAENTAAMVDLGCYFIEKNARSLLPTEQGQKELEQAFRLFERAMNAGDPKGKFFYAQCLENGEGTAKNLERAIILYHELNDSGDTTILPLVAQKLLYLPHG
jgi:uncharacterized protein